MFKKYLQFRLQGQSLHYNCYLGISKKDFPKWQGWKLINEYKKRHINIKDIKDKRLEQLVENHYHLQWIKQSY